MSWVGRFCCLQLISCTPSGFFQRYQRQLDAIRVFPHERRKASILVGSGFQSISRQACGRTCPCMEAASAFGSWGHQWSLQREPHTRVVQAKVKNLTSSIISRWQHSLDLCYRKFEIVKSVPLGSALWSEAGAQHRHRVGSVQTADR